MYKYLYFIQVFGHYDSVIGGIFVKSPAQPRLFKAQVPIESQSGNIPGPHLQKAGFGPFCGQTGQSLAQQGGGNAPAAEGRVHRDGVQAGFSGGQLKSGQGHRAAGQPGHKEPGRLKGQFLGQLGAGPGIGSVLLDGGADLQIGGLHGADHKLVHISGPPASFCPGSRRR